MEPVVAIAGMVLILALAFTIGYPFFAHQQGHAAAIGMRGRQLRERQEQLYALLKELEFDRDLGKVSAGDHARLRRPLEEEAMQLIQELDELNGHPRIQALRQRVEADVRAHRELLATDPGERCPACQAPRRRSDRFCPQCGRPLGEQGN
ncbi:MAG: zinc ribbon domain-containing protein [Candidatus Latescibacterota bacterium]